MPILHKIKAQEWSTGSGAAYLHWCPGCEQLHLINTENPNHCGAVWSFDGNMERPTFSPSINIVGRCHYFIRDGQIQFCSDSAHQLKGQSVPLPEIPEGMTDD